MQRLKSTLVPAAALAACAVLSPSSAFAQSLDGMWLKLTVKANGINVDNRDDSVRGKGAFRTTCYMLVTSRGSSRYTTTTACLTAGDVWRRMSESPSFTRFSDDGGYASDEDAHYTNRRGHTIEGAGTHLLTPTYNKKGEVTKAKLQSWGGLSRKSSLNPGVTHLLGGYTAVGSSLALKQIPTDVIAVLDDDVAASLPAPGNEVAIKILALVNAERRSGGACGGDPRPAVGPLRLDPALSDAAAAHARDMASNNFFSHTGSDNSNPFQRIAAAGFSGSPRGENIAAGYPNAASAVAGWMDSPGHCDNIMDPDYRFLGADLAFNAATRYGHYWVQTFGGS